MKVKALFSALALFAGKASAHSCIHDQMEWNPITVDTEELSGYEDLGLQAGGPLNLKIHVDHSNLKIDPRATTYVQQQLMPSISDYFGAALKLKQRVSP